MNKTILILVEGQTEERFVKDVLNPELPGLWFVPTIVVTKEVVSGPNKKGGMTSYTKFKRDLFRLLKNTDKIITTMVDYYRLPDDFPGMENRPENASPEDRVTHVEQQICLDLSKPKNFLPYLSLHEFEACLFSSSTVLPKTVIATHPQEEKFRKMCEAVETPEMMNERPNQSPSKRILSIFPEYNKVIHGSTAAKRIGLENIRRACPHFDSWLHSLKKMAKLNI
ncbi:MAG: DUF4276 family protein [Gammaproteobacteria bacterium]|nr:DUF4276 family protein [Gammaproteobacteria bacterium]